jgi:hypothetical protein
MPTGSPLRNFLLAERMIWSLQGAAHTLFRDVSFDSCTVKTRLHIRLWAETFTLCEHMTVISFCSIQVDMFKTNFQCHMGILAPWHLVGCLDTGDNNVALWLSPGIQVDMFKTNFQCHMGILAPWHLVGCLDTGDNNVALWLSPGMVHSGYEVWYKQLWLLYCVTVARNFV